jgi:hypothetical protein
LPWRCMWNGCTDPRFLYCSTSCRQVVRSTSLLLTLGERAPVPIVYESGGPRVCLEEMQKGKFLTLPRLELRPLCRSACSQLLYQLCYPGSDFCTKWRSTNYRVSLQLIENKIKLGYMKYKIELVKCAMRRMYIHK